MTHLREALLGMLVVGIAGCTRPPPIPTETAARAATPVEQAEPEPATEPEPGDEPRGTEAVAEHSLRPGQECAAFDLMTSRSNLPPEQRDAVVAWYRKRIRELQRFAVLDPKKQHDLLVDSGTLVSGEINQRAADELVGFAGITCHITAGILVDDAGTIEVSLILDDVSPGTVAISMQHGTAADSRIETIQATIEALIAELEDPSNDRVVVR